MWENTNESVSITANILIGLPATGKTTFCSKNFTDNQIISLDILKSRSREIERVLECISLRQPFVIDNTNATQDERARYIAEAKNGGYRVCGYFLVSKVKDAVAQNLRRDAAKRVPEVAIFTIAKRLQRPAKEEGFDELFSVQFDGSGGFIVTKFQDNK